MLLCVKYWIALHFVARMSAHNFRKSGTATSNAFSLHSAFILPWICMGFTRWFFTETYVWAQFRKAFDGHAHFPGWVCLLARVHSDCALHLEFGGWASYSAGNGKARRVSVSSVVMASVQWIGWAIDLRLCPFSAFICSSVFRWPCFYQWSYLQLGRLPSVGPTGLTILRVFCFFASLFIFFHLPFSGLSFHYRWECLINVLCLLVFDVCVFFVFVVPLHASGLAFILYRKSMT